MHKCILKLLIRRIGKITLVEKSATFTLEYNQHLSNKAGDKNSTATTVEST